MFAILIRHRCVFSRTSIVCVFRFSFFLRVIFRNLDYKISVGDWWSQWLCRCSRSSRCVLLSNIAARQLARTDDVWQCRHRFHCASSNRLFCFYCNKRVVLILTKNLCAFRSSRWSIENRAIDSAAFAKVDRTCNEIGISFFCACFCRRWIDRTRWFDLHVCMFAQFVSVRDAQYSAPPYRLSLQRCRHHVAFYHVDSLYWRAESFRSLLGMLFVPSFSPFLFLLFLCSSCTTDKQTLSYKKRHCVLQDAFVVSSEKWHF